MKQRFIYFLFIAALAAGCGEDSPTQGNEGNQSLIISGKVRLWEYKSSLSVNLSKIENSVPSFILAAGVIDSGGNFNITAPPAPESACIPIKELTANSDYFGLPEMSDTTVKFIPASIILLNENNFMGIIQWSQGSWIDKTLCVFNETRYFYFNKSANIKGKFNNSISGESIEYNISAKAGWNILLYRIKEDRQNLKTEKFLLNYEPFEASFSFIPYWGD